MAAIPDEMIAIDPAGAGRAGGAAAGRAAGAAARARRGADPGRGGRGQPARRAAAPRPLSAAAGRAVDPGPRGRRRRSSRSATGVARMLGPAGLRAGRRRRLCRILRSRPPASACRCRPAARMVEAAALPETLFTVWTNLFERGCAPRRRDGAGPWRHQRHRHDGDRCSASCSASTIIVTCGSRREMRAARVALGADHAINYATQDFVEEVKRHHRRRGRRRRARHGRRRLSAAQPRLPRRGRPPRLDRGPARRRPPSSTSRRDAPAADPDRLDAAAALGRVQGAGRRRDRAQRSGRMSRPASCGR